MARIVWTEPSLQDLDSIAEYIALENAAAAAKMVQRVFEKVGRLARFPDSGRRPPELRRLAYREVVVPPCRVFYRVDGDTVIILHVMRSERALDLPPA